MITKADIVLAIVLLVLGLGSPFLLRSDAAEDSRVVITVDGEEMGSYPLSEDRTLVLTEDGLFEKSEAGTREILNLIVIESGSARVEEASCKGNDCVKMGKISREGEIIACLPHKMLISISGGGDPADVIIK